MTAQSPRAVIFAAAHGSTYSGKDSSGFALAADAIRAASQDDAALVEHWDFDLGGPLFDGKPACCIDARDLPTTMRDNAVNRVQIEAKTLEVLALPAVPILLGETGPSRPRPALARPYRWQASYKRYDSIGRRRRFETRLIL